MAPDTPMIVTNLLAGIAVIGAVVVLLLTEYRRQVQDAINDPRLLSTPYLPPPAFVEVKDAYGYVWVISLADISAISAPYEGGSLLLPESSRLSFIHLGPGTGIRLEVRPDEAVQVRDAWQTYMQFTTPEDAED